MNQPLPSSLDLVGEWDAIAANAAFSHPVETEAWRRRFPDGAQLLDVGCGYGRATRELADAGFKVIGVDCAEAMIQRGRRERPDLDLRWAPPGRLPFEDASFDGALLAAVLTCIPASEDREQLAAELARVLRPGGRLLVSDLLLQTNERNRVRYAAGAAKFGETGTFQLEGGPTLKHFTLTELRALFSSFAEENTIEFAVTTMRGNAARAARLWLIRA